MNAAALELTFGRDMHPAAAAAIADLHERLRGVAEALLKDPKWVRQADPETLAWAAKWASIKPLGRALSDGTPAPARAFSEGAL